MSQSADVLANFRSPVLAVAGYYAPRDNYQHVIAATRDNVVTEIWWRPGGKNSIHGQTELAEFKSPIVAIAGYYADIDKYQHVIVAELNALTEIWWDPKTKKRGQAQLAQFGSHVIAIAGYYAESDKYQHVIVATADKVVTELWWKPAGGVGRTELAQMDRPIVGVAGIDGRYAYFDANNVVVVSTDDGNLELISWPEFSFGRPVGGINRESIGHVGGVSAITIFAEDNSFNELIGVVGGSVESLPHGGGPYQGDRNWGERPGIVSLAAYYAPDKFNHVIVGVGGQVEEWFYFPPPPQPRVPAPTVDFSVTPNDGRSNHAYFNVGGSATLHWNVTGCQNCTVSMRGFGGLNLETVIMNSPKLPVQGTLPVTPGSNADRINTKYALTATGANGTTTREVFVDQYVPPGPGPQGQQEFCFKLTNPASFALPCLTYCVIAKDQDTAKKVVEAAYGGYKAESISAANVTTACQ